MAGTWDTGPTYSLFGVSAAGGSPLGGLFAWAQGISSSFNTGAITAGTDPGLGAKIVADAITGNNNYTPAQTAVFSHWFQDAALAWNNDNFVSQVAHTAAGGLAAGGSFFGAGAGVALGGAAQGAASAAGGVSQGLAQTATAGITAGIGGALQGAASGIGTGIAALGGGASTILGNTSGILGGGSSSTLWIAGGIVLLAVVLLAS